MYGFAVGFMFSPNNLFLLEDESDSWSQGFYPIIKNLQVTPRNSMDYQCPIISFWLTKKYINKLESWLLAFASFLGSLDPRLSETSAPSQGLSGSESTIKSF